MKAWQLLDSREKWCRNWTAVDEHGELTEYNGDKACKWCAIGAIFKCYPDDMDASLRISLLSSKIGASIGKWNDHHEWKEVHALLKELDI